MRVSYKWLKEYVDFDISPQQLADKLTMAGIAVDAVEYLGKGIDNILVGHVLEVTGHPNADKLVICKIEVGGEIIQIVTGAPNVSENAKVAVAMVGAKLPDGMKIKKAKLRGELSAGMVCSAQELGIDPKHFPEDQRQGIIIFPDDTQVGADVKQVLGLDDHILILDLTPNRSDCMALVNVAREVAAITGSKFKQPAIKVEETNLKPINQWAGVEINDKELCHRYVARVITDVTIGASPQWMQQRLRAAGVRPINNVVDVTNYVMMELGQPLHAFDYDKLAGHKIIVRKAGAGEELVTLDEDRRSLDDDMLVIADTQGPVAVAGIMGGLDSEVTGQTKTILLEAAYFQGASIRRTARKLGLRSESSSRFEKGIDKGNVAIAADRAAQLLASLAGGSVVPEVIDVYPDTWQQPVITLRCQRVNQLLGTNISNDDIEGLLAGLSLDVKAVGVDLLEVKAPSYRNDLTGEIDLVEEVARLYGYDNIETTAPEGRLVNELPTQEQMLRKKVTEIALGCGLNEIISYSFISPKAMDRLMVDAGHQLRNNVVMQNPLSEEQSVMRTTLLPGMVDTAAKNFKRRQTNIALFEIGRVYHPSDGPLPDEKMHLAAIVSGENLQGWVSQPQEMDFFYLKGIVEEIFDDLEIAGYKLEPVRAKQYPFLHPGRAAVITLSGEENSLAVGYIGEVHPHILEQAGVQQRAVALELNLNEISRFVNFTPIYAQLPKYPAVVRDMALVVSEEYSVADINSVIKQYGGNLLDEVYLFDVYQGKQIASGYRSLAYSMKYQAEDRTLTDDEVTVLHKKIQNALQDKFAAELR